MSTMQVQLGIATLRNPVILAAGTCGVMGEISDAINLSTLGAITTKSITLEPRVGNEPHRLADLAVGMINAIGLANEGIESFASKYAATPSTLDTTVIGSIAGDSIDGYVNVAKKMSGITGINLLEVNVSCPNTDDGLEFGSDPKRISALLDEVKPAIGNCSMIVKLSAACGDIRPHADAAIKSGADALTLINTLPALAIDVESKSPRISRGVGGLSGQAIHPIAVRVVHEVYQDVAKSAGIPIIGTGGILHWQDAAEFILAGATAVGIGTATFVNPKIATKIVTQLSKWTDRLGCSSINELTGSATTASQA